MHRTNSVRRCVRPFMLGVALTLGTAGSAVAQRGDTAVVTGRVTSEGGVAIPSAIVTIPTLKLSTQTNDAGSFRLVVPGAASRTETLHITRLGYRPRDVPFTLAPGQISVNVLMAATAVALDQVVVTGT